MGAGQARLKMRATHQLCLLAFCAWLAGCGSTGPETTEGWVLLTQQHPMDGEMVSARRAFSQPGASDFSGVIEITCTMSNQWITVTLESHNTLSDTGEGSEFLTSTSVSEYGVTTTPVGRIRWNGQEPLSAAGLVNPFTHTNVVRLDLREIIGDGWLNDRLPIVVALQNGGGEAIFEIPAGNEAISSVLAKCGQQADVGSRSASPASAPSTETEVEPEASPFSDVQAQGDAAPVPDQGPENPTDTLPPPVASSEGQGADSEAVGLAQEQSAKRKLMYAGAQTVVDETGDPLFVPAGELGISRYPAKELREGVGGTVSVRIRISKEGYVISSLAVESSGNRNLDRAAVDAARKWRFTPVRRAEEMQEVERTFPITFTPPDALGD